MCAGGKLYFMDLSLLEEYVCACVCFLLVVVWMMNPQEIFPHLGNCEHNLIWKKGLCRWNLDEDPEMRSSPTPSRWLLNSMLSILSKTEEEKTQRRRAGEDVAEIGVLQPRLRSLEPPASGRSQEQDLPEPLETAEPADVVALDFWCSEWWSIFC